MERNLNLIAGFLETARRPWTRYPSIASFLLVSLLAFTLTTAPAAVGQIPRLPAQTPSSTLNPTADVIRVGNLISAPVILDGYKLFRVAAVASIRTEEQNGQFPIQTRVEIIQNELKGIIENPLYGGRFRRGFDSDTLEVTVGTLNNSTVIFVADGDQLAKRQVMTVTPQDAQLYGLSVETWAENLTDTISFALIRAQIERSPQYLLDRSLISGGIILAVILVSRILTLLQKRALAQWETLKELEPQAIAESPPTTEAELPIPQQQSEIVQANQERYTWERQRNINTLQRWLLQWSQLIIWAAAFTGILRLFPWTRWLHFLLLKQPIGILLIFIGTNLAIRGSSVAIDRFFKTLQETETLTRTASQRQALRFSTFSVVLKGIATFLFTSTGIILMLNQLQIPVGPVLAGAGIIGIAISFASQSFVKDVINGCLILLEDQYAVGDVIDVGGASGLVEYMNLRVTQLRGAGGRLSTIPNGSISIVHNLTKDWSRADFTIDVSYDTDVELALAVLKQVAEQMQSDPEWQETILDPINLLGVNRIDHSGIQIVIWIKTQPIKQWAVEREFRRRLKLAFAEHGISIGIPQRSLLLPHYPELLMLAKNNNLDRPLSDSK
ncbi:MAG: mechanosensitive ion channel family protein [Hormoscilla sp. SP5CHS1]|nr:mechanosensitive ion channel family protein [Hormoscilla sp. SP12CHS1]MBC6453700.1 mechanosensitive ion channel family protein [Hormoscilla sp. SP5CHS1]